MKTLPARRVGAGPMFRPLRHALDRVVTTGYLCLIEAEGRAFAFGDRSGAPVVARITDAGDRAATVPQSRAGARRGVSWMAASSWSGARIYDFLALLLLKSRPRPRAALGEERGGLPLHTPRAAPVQSAAPRQAQRRSTTTTSTAASTSSSSTATASIPAPISSRRTCRSRRRKPPRSATSPPSSCSQPA